MAELDSLHLDLNFKEKSILNIRCTVISVYCFATIMIYKTRHSKNLKANGEEAQEKSPGLYLCLCKCMYNIFIINCSEY